MSSLRWSSLAGEAHLIAQHMAEFVAHSEFAEAVAQLLSRYGFDLAERSPQFTIAHWLQHYPPAWLRLAVLEALYQGRYKVVSVEQILRLWQRRGQPVCHFNGEFERIICDEFPQRLLESEVEPSPLEPAAPVPPAAPAPLPDPGYDDGQPSLAAPCEDVRPIPPFASKKLAPPPAVKEPQFSTWVEASTGGHPIHRFVPVAEPSSFYARLQEIAHQDNPLQPPDDSSAHAAKPSEPQLENVSGLDPEHLG